MIARDDELRAMGQRTQKIHGARQLVEGAVPQHVSRVDEDVPAGNDEPLVMEVRVGQRDYPDAAAHETNVSDTNPTTPAL